MKNKFLAPHRILFHSIAALLSLSLFTPASTFAQGNGHNSHAHSQKRQERIEKHKEKRQAHKARAEERKTQIKEELMALPPEERETRMKELREEHQEKIKEERAAHKAQFEEHWRNASPEEKIKLCENARKRCTHSTSKNNISDKERKSRKPACMMVEKVCHTQK